MSVFDAFSGYSIKAWAKTARSAFESRAISVPGLVRNLAIATTIATSTIAVAKHQGVNDSLISYAAPSHNSSLVGVSLEKGSASIQLPLFKESLSKLLSTEAKRVIGEYGLRRLEHFGEYLTGWDSGLGSPIDRRSLTNFSEFLRATKLKPQNAAIFMSHDGELMLNWERSNGDVIELTFAPDSVGYYFESTDEEGSVSNSDAAVEMLDKIRMINRLS